MGWPHGWAMWPESGWPTEQHRPVDFHPRSDVAGNNEVRASLGRQVLFHPLPGKCQTAHETHVPAYEIRFRDGHFVHPDPVPDQSRDDEHTPLPDLVDE